MSVRDDGMGIDPEGLAQIFTMFSQPSRGLERSQGGLGIGLSLVRGLVELHGGRIEARSDGPGKGSEFVVTLSVAGQLAAPAAAQEAAEEARAWRFLIVDDLRESADSLAMLLRVMGHEADTAYDGEEGVAAAERVRPEIVLLDLGMPRLNGYDACRRIRQQPWGAGMVLIALTGWGRESDRQQTGEAGFDHHLVKPVDPKELLEAVAAVERTRTARGA